MELSSPLRILLIEDDPRMVELLRRGLWERGHTIVTAATAQEGQQLAEDHEFDAILLDICLPDRSGVTVARALAGKERRPAILMLTALREEDHVVLGLESGADDYLTKPFSFLELLARLNSASRRSRLFRSGDIVFGGFTLDTERRRLMHNLTDVHLTRSEFLLLRELALRSPEAVPRRHLMQAVWQTTQVTDGALDTLVAALREKLDRYESGHIATLRGLGYALQQEPAA